MCWLSSPAEGFEGGRPVWVDRGGRTNPAPAADFDDALYPRLSPDGRRVALIRSGDIWVADLGGLPPIRLTSDGRERPHFTPLWTPDGRRLIYETQQPTRASAMLAVRRQHDDADRTWAPKGISIRRPGCRATRSASWRFASVRTRMSWPSRPAMEPSTNSSRRPVAKAARGCRCRRTGGGWRTRRIPPGKWKSGCDHIRVPARRFACRRMAAPSRCGRGTAVSSSISTLRRDRSWWSRYKPAPSSASRRLSRCSVRPALVIAPQPPSYDVAADGRFLMIEGGNRANRVAPIDDRGELGGSDYAAPSVEKHSKSGRVSFDAIN